MLHFTKIFFRKFNSITKDRSTGFQFLKLFSILTLILVLHSIAMVKFENLTIGDAIWLTMSSASTVGYGDFSAKTFSGRTSTIILLFILGVATLAQVAALFFEHRREVRKQMLTGDWRWTMKNHIVFMNCPKEMGEEYFYHAIFGFRDSNSELSNNPIIIVSDQFKEGLSNRLHKLNVVHVSKPAYSKDTLESANIKAAHTVVILSKDRLDETSDSINFELIDRLKDMGVAGRIIVEAVKDENRARLKKIGADNVLRPIRTYPEMLIRAIISPGSEQVIETLFNSDGEECIRYEISLNSRWLDIIQKFTMNDLGIPIAYENIEGNVINAPSSKEMVITKAVYVIVNQSRIRSINHIKAILR